MTRRPSDRAVDRPLRVALLTHSFPPNTGGVERITEQLARGLSNRHGFVVDVLTLSGGDVSDVSALPYSLTIRPGVRQVIRAIRAADVSVFHAPMLKFALLPALARRPRISVVHGRMRDSTNAIGLGGVSRLSIAGLKLRALATARLHFIRTADATIAVSADVATETGSKAVVIHNGFDESVFDLSVPVDERNPQSIAFVGRLSPEKGVDVLIHAVAASKAQGVVFELTIIGDGSLGSQLEALAAELNITDHTRFLGRLDPVAVAAVLNATSILAIPSVALESFAVTGIEAQACGCAVVASEVGGVPESLSPGGGLLVPPGDSHALGEALMRVARDRALRASLVEQGAFNAQRHTSAAMTDAHARVLQAVATASR